jgi:anthranilate phosphoribosyltransferase
MPLQSHLKQVIEARATLTREQSRELLEQILAGALADIEVAALVGALAARGETPAEVAGFVDTMRAAVTHIPITSEEQALLVDTCGTGGDASRTFNISTAAALVAVAAGAKVAKHGNRAVTSYCGSADVLEAMGVPVALAPDQAVECLRATGFMFLYAPALHPALKRVQPVRRTLGFRTIFNLAGPLTNPAAAPVQVMGVYSGEKVSPVAETMARLGVRRAFVVHGFDGLDELTLTSESHVAEVTGKGNHVTGKSVRLFRLTPEETGLPRTSMAELAGGKTASENAAILERIFDGQPGPKRDIVLLNAAAALVAAGVAVDFKEGVARGAEAIDSGAARTTVVKLQEFGKRR